MDTEIYNNPNKIYLTIKAVFYPDAFLKPISLIWENGREYQIDKVLDIRRAASLKAGGSGLRYTCRTGHKEFYLYFEEGRWFMEK